MTLANKITVGRLFLIPLFVAIMLYYSPERDAIRWVALGIYLLAEVTDIVDGYIARHFHQKTVAGSILDPLADKILFLSAIICLYKISWDHGWGVKFPSWIVVAFAAREIFLLLGSLLIELKKGGIEIRPNMWGKVTAFLQVLCVVSVFVQLPLAAWVWGLALIVTTISAIIYMNEGIRVLNDGHR